MSDFDIYTLEDLVGRIAADIERDRKIAQIKQNLMTVLAAAAFAAVIFALGFACGHIVGFDRALGDCPAEDSCHPDYYDGEWHIIPGEREQVLLPN